MFPGLGIFDAFPRIFNKQFRCYSVALCPGNEREDVEKGGKIIMPPSALDILTRLNIVYPMLFKLTNNNAKRYTHCGVLEFVADEGKVFIPHWMMRNLCLDEGQILQVETATLPVATYSKFQPQSTDFLDITNPKAVLENALRSYACLTVGDVIAITYNKKVYEFLVLEAKPGRAVSIIECDMQVEFAAPVGYVEPQRQPKKDIPEEEIEDEIDVGFQAFSGSGFRLDGKKKKNCTSNTPVSSEHVDKKRGIPNYDYCKGTLTFKRVFKSNNFQKKENESNEFSPFAGSGQQLRPKRSRKRME
ncbi:ubiquitin recognition factor in ER-associated degradation protein 1-like [Xenia sp. Carnegie-2017]|uniref:ubiquitin recognition factor in ER-associated degradation protein 1-like n=1 Tax=Xenia sp. Carnegie-2017 TaxID=2897299 RepID=UPI001F04A015|nr:ubiquitin recognition factor in ER-associated degradation protein 1-like [Xenia sp. Carnegie-2017]